MSGTPGIPNNLMTQSGNGNILVSWDLSAGATSYLVQRSLDNVTYAVVATLSGTPLSISYLDTTVAVNTAYYYKVAAANTSGTSPYTQASPATYASMSGEMTLAQIRLASQQRADRVNSQFVTTQEWNFFINQAMFELYDLLITVYEDYSMAVPVQFNSDGITFQYPLPDGKTTYFNGLNPTQTIVARPLYKLSGVDLALNTANNGYVTINKFNFIDRNRFVYPNTASTIYGVFNLQYRMLGNNIEFIPTPSAGQSIRLWYIPRLQTLLQDSDTSDIGISGWLQYVIIRAAKYALDKEESDTSMLTQEILYLKQRIEESAANRDAGQPDKISDTRGNNGGWGYGSGWTNGGSGGGF